MQMKKYRLGELMKVTRGMSLGGEFYSTQGELMRLTLGNFDYKNNCFKDDKSKDNLFFTGTVKPEFILKKGDIITPLNEQAIGLLGSTARIPCSGKYIQSQDVALIKCNENLNPDFAFYLIPSKFVRNQLSAAAQQTKIRHTSPDKIKNCTVWIPEYSAQKKIGSVKVRSVIKGTPAELWKKTEKYSGICREKFFSYFEGKETAFAYKLGEVQSYNPPRNLTDYNIKTAPQSFVYL